MSNAQPAPGADPARGRAAGDWQDTFLAALAQTSNVSASARRAGVNVSCVYKARRADRAFADAWFQALCEGYDALEMDLLRRLRLGEIERSGAKSRRKYDNATAFRLLAAHRDTVGREKARREDEDEETILASINAKLDSMRERERKIEAIRDNGTNAPGDDRPSGTTA